MAAVLSRERSFTTKISVISLCFSREATHAAITACSSRAGTIAEILASSRPEAALLVGVPDAETSIGVFGNSLNIFNQQKLRVDLWLPQAPCLHIGIWMPTRSSHCSGIV